ncbi:hypothetical protein EYB25_007858 [Talaromyces marneffei]|uniref:Zn(2)-C6 fungal-type domain-containing protein n=2 Tax=Talaromyces marneffei TaxID=37727 RepID=B6QQQ4_TALMQ|nr:conserved hypothetical protein [Talaromyces marneffei ATCC 18224]KAE8549337.1 hypothetical protein EYB25_007858 [Talaromyces marneffei]
MPGVPTSRGCDACRKQKKKCDAPKPPTKCPRCTRLKIPCTGYGVQRYKFLPIDGDTGREQKRQRGPSQTIMIEYKPNEKSLNQRPPVIRSLGTSTDTQSESELMHRWLTRTAWCFYMVPKDKAYLETLLPQAALMNSSLMNSILALAAADFAHSGQKAYLRPALEYHAKAVAEMRIQLTSVGQRSIDDLYPSALLMAAFNFVASPQPRTIDRLIPTLNMLASANKILLTYAASRPECQFEIMSSIDMTILGLLDPETTVALDRLTAISHQIELPASDDKSSSCFAEDSQLYQVTIAHIKYSFAEEVRDVIKNYCWTVTSVNDPEFFDAVRNSEPMALLIIMYFGVLLDMMGRKGNAITWWLCGQGKDVVDDISQILKCSPVAQIPDVQDAIAWARQKVGLLENSPTGA